MWTWNNLILLVKELNLRKKLVQEPYETLKFIAGYFDYSLAFFVKMVFLCQTLSCTCQQAFAFNNLLLILLFLVFSFVSTLGFVSYAIFMYSISRVSTTEDRKVMKTQEDQKDLSRDDEDKVKNTI